MIPRTSRKLARSFALLLFIFVAIAACSKNNDGLSLAELEASCSVNSDCMSPLVCAFKSCHVECSPGEGGESRDCPSGEQCLASDRPYYVCQNPDEKNCNYNSDCPSPLVCGRDLICRDQCQVASDCQSGQLCVTGTCANIAQLVDGGLVAAAGVDAAQTNPTCSYNTDCVAPEVCRTNGLCGLECKGDRDCAAGQVCVGNLCTSESVSVDAATTGDRGDATITSTTDASDATLADSASPLVIPDGSPDGYGTSCSFDSDCPIGLICNRSNECTYECVVPSDCDVAHGFCCSQFHTCLTGSVCLAATTDASTDGGGATTDAGASDGAVEAGKPCANDSNCQDGVFCNGVERCVAGACAAATTTACDDADPCTADTCTEATQSCSHVATGPIDQDHDGHYATSCGAGGDDCDDTNPNVYTGHPEICDYIDNNCNGEIDEGLWSAGATTLVTNASSSLQQPPGFLQLSDGSFVVVVGGSAGYQTSTSEIAYKLPASLATVGTGVAVSYPVGGGYSSGAYIGYPTVASNGTTIAFASQYTGTGTDLLLGFSALDLTQETNGILVSTSSEGAPSLTWVGAQSKYLATWADGHIAAGNTLTVYAAWVAPGTQVPDAGSTAAAVTSTHPLLATQTDCATPNSSNPVPSAAGPNSVLVAYELASTGHTRWVLMDPTTTSNLVAPVDTTQADSIVPQEAYFDGTNFVLLTTDAGGTVAHVRRINPATAAVVDETTLSNYGQGSSGYNVAPLHGGYAVATAYGTTLRFGFSPSLTTAFTYSQIGQFGVGNTTYAPVLVPVDDKHVAIAWHAYTNSYATNVAMLTCGN